MNEHRGLVGIIGWLLIIAGSGWLLGRPGILLGVGIPMLVGAWVNNGR